MPARCNLSRLQAFSLPWAFVKGSPTARQLWISGRPIQINSKENEYLPWKRKAVYHYSVSRLPSRRLRWPLVLTECMHRDARTARVLTIMGMAPRLRGVAGHILEALAVIALALKTTTVNSSRLVICSELLQTADLHSIPRDTHKIERAVKG